MDTTLTQADIDVFGTDPSTVKEQPDGANYSNGVEVMYTAPAKWWNWFWNILTSWFTKHKADYQSIITEETNLLGGVGITPDALNAHQITEGFRQAAEDYAEDYNDETVEDGGVERPVNRPYVTGRTIVLPDTELL